MNHRGQSPISQTPGSLARRGLGTLMLGFAIGTLLDACGLRTPVRPPEDTAPVIPGVVEARRDDAVVVVRWKRADRSMDGERVDDLAAFVIERRRSDENDWQRIATVNVVDQEKIRRRRDFSYRDADAGAGDVSYRVIAVDSDGQEGPPTEPADAVTPPPAEASPEAPAASTATPAPTAEAPAASTTPPAP